MKFVSLVFSLFASVSAFANPFASFKGAYKPASQPQVFMDGMSYCNWQGFRGITGYEIGTQNGLYAADLSSNANNSPMHSYSTFQEYSYSGEFGVKSFAKISGDSNRAIYEIVNSNPQSMEIYHWSISRNGPNFHLRMKYSTNHLSPSVRSCTYDVDLVRR
jgi:hypothetical protein